MMTVMDVASEQAQRLLARVRYASEQSRRAQEEANRLMREASEARGEAVRAALDADIPRVAIAEAAGVNRNILYRIAGKTTR